MNGRRSDLDSEKLIRKVFDVDPCRPRVAPLGDWEAQEQRLGLIRPECVPNNNLLRSDMH